MKRIWIAERLKELSQKKSQLGAALSLPPSRVSEILSGKRQIQSHEITLLAQFLAMDLSQVMRHLSTEGNLPVKGGSQMTETLFISGKYCQKNNTYQLWPEAQKYSVTLPKQASHQSDSKIGLEHICEESGAVSLYICVNKDKKSAAKALFSNTGDLEELKIISEYHQCANPETSKISLT